MTFKIIKKNTHAEKADVKGTSPFLYINMASITISNQVYLQLQNIIGYLSFCRPIGVAATKFLIPFVLHSGRH